MGNKAGEMLALYNIGSAYGELGQHQRAAELLDSITIATGKKEPYRQALALSGPPQHHKGSNVMMRPCNTENGRSAYYRGSVRRGK
ncbi:MAG: hypothetical protein IPO87_12545 [Flavobacteriales bacterium]|nr:hypothetical protein [Flavobacteriales bacterium]